MNELCLRIVELEPMRIAYYRAIGSSPEMDAWRVLSAWAEHNDLIEPSTRFFGFNNPNPEPSKPTYGYEVWMTVDPDARSSDDVGIKEFSGGRYAVTRTRLSVIEKTWHDLYKWCLEHDYVMGNHQSLEEHITPPGTSQEEMLLDLYLPID